MMVRGFTIRALAYGLALMGLALIFVPSVTLSKTVRCQDLFVRSVSIFERQQNLDLIRSSVEIDKRAVYYEHLKAKPGKETLVVLSGLFTPLSDLAAFQVEFAMRSKGEGLIILAYSTQIESMIWNKLRYGREYGLESFERLSLADLVREVTAVMNAESIHTQVSVLGYSYGAAPAARFSEFHRNRVSNVIMVAPLIVPGDHSPQIHSSKEAYEVMARLNPFFGKALIDSMREGVARNAAESIVDGFLKRQKLPDSVTKEAVIAGLFTQIRAAETFDLRQENTQVWPRTHFLMASGEHAYRLALQQALFDRISKDAKYPGEGEIVKDAQHALLASNPKAAVDFVLRIMRGKRQ